MPCQLEVTHRQGPPPVTKVTCAGKCGPVYRKVEKPQKKGPPKTEPEAVARTCKRITKVDFDEKSETFKIQSTFCACVIEGADCKYSPEADPKDGSKLKKAECVGICEELFEDKEFQKKLTQTCAMILENDEVKCVCYSI